MYKISGVSVRGVRRLGGSSRSIGVRGLVVETTASCQGRMFDRDCVQGERGQPQSFLPPSEFWRCILSPQSPRGMVACLDLNRDSKNGDEGGESGLDDGGVEVHQRLWQIEGAD